MENDRFNSGKGIDQQIFWQNQVSNLRRRYQNFSLDNTDRTVQWFQGQDKYPIRFWNDTQERMEEIRTIYQAKFFFKPAQKEIEALKKEEQQMEEIRSSRPITNTQSGLSIGNAGLSNQTATDGTSMTLDRIFKQML